MYFNRIVGFWALDKVLGQCISTEQVRRCQPWSAMTRVARALLHERLQLFQVHRVLGHLPCLFSIKLSTIALLSLGTMIPCRR